MATTATHERGDKVMGERPTPPLHTPEVANMVTQAIEERRQRAASLAETPLPDTSGRFDYK